MIFFFVKKLDIHDGDTIEAHNEQVRMFIYIRFIFFAFLSPLLTMTFFLPLLARRVLILLSIHIYYDPIIF